MSRNPGPRTATALILTALLAASPEARAAGRKARPHGKAERQATARTGGGYGLLATAWRWLASVWEEEGGLIDPNGAQITPTAPIPPPPPRRDEGGLIDPNGISVERDSGIVHPVP